ncbi:unnamed protein product [Arctia plantaginis]|uniref:Uncharacterized protein n=1 Tax=Arctia plantaginis TaxID=874455 RepID=A0A8S0Z5V8_ARCPL|nr:unnamed protein product [Arctia plantaginis]
MKVEIPKFERCCCCLPLRRGILTFAYLNLFITIFFGVLQVSLWVYYYYPFMKLQSSMMVMYRGIVIEAQMFFVIALHVLDVVFNIILIVGAHMTNAKLMRWYYFYQLTMMIANFFAMLVIYTGISKVSGLDTYPTLSECAVAFIGFVVQIYLLLLVHSELNKLRYQERRSSFVNHMAEKNVKLIKTFYYYNILLLGLTSILTVYGGISAVIYTVDGFKRGLNANFLMYFLSIDIGLLLANFALQLYILLVVRSEIIKLSSDCQFRFANIGSEAECTMTIEGLTKENRVQNIHANPVITKGSEIKGLVGREDNVN